MNRGGFSWRRFLGVSAAQSRLSRAIGIPLSRSGRQQKLGRMLMGGGRRGSGGGSGCSGCMLIIFVVLCTGWKGCSAIFSPATNPPAYSSSTASGQVPVAGPASGQAQVPEKTDTPKADTPKADDASEGQSPASRDSFKTKEPAPDPLLLKSLEGLQLPTTVTSIAPLSLLEPGGKEVTIPVNSIIKVVTRSEHGILTLEIRGTVFVGHEYRIADKVRLR